MPSNKNGRNRRSKSRGSFRSLATRRQRGRRIKQRDSLYSVADANYESIDETTAANIVVFRYR